MKPIFGELKEALSGLPLGTKILTVKNGSASTFFEKMGADRWVWLHPTSDGKPSSFDKIVGPHTEVYVVWTPTVGVHNDPDMSATLRRDTDDMWVLVHPNGDTAAEFSEREAKKFGYRIPTNSTDRGTLTVERVASLPVGSGDDMLFRHGDYWVFPQSDTSGGDRRVAVLVPGEGFVVYREDRLPGYVEGLQPSGYLAAAKAYFAAHPKSEPKKPWLDAQSGEVWSVSDGDQGGLAVCRREPDQDSGDDHPYFYGPNFDGVRGDALTAGTRLEMQS